MPQTVPIKPMEPSADSMGLGFKARNAVWPSQSLKRPALYTDRKMEYANPCTDMGWIRLCGRANPIQPLPNETLDKH